MEVNIRPVATFFYIFRYEGKQSFEYILTPLKAGLLTIPAISFSYFDPLQEKYLTSFTQEHPLRVDPGESWIDSSTSTLSVDPSLVSSRLHRRLEARIVSQYKGVDPVALRRRLSNRLLEFIIYFSSQTTQCCCVLLDLGLNSPSWTSRRQQILLCFFALWAGGRHPGRAPYRVGG